MKRLRCRSITPLKQTYKNLTDRQYIHISSRTLFSRTFDWFMWNQKYHVCRQRPICRGRAPYSGERILRNYVFSWDRMQSTRKIIVEEVLLSFIGASTASHWRTSARFAPQLLAHFIGLYHSNISHYTNLLFHSHFESQTTRGFAEKCNQSVLH